MLDFTCEDGKVGAVGELERSKNRGIGTTATKYGDRVKEYTNNKKES